MKTPMRQCNLTKESNPTKTNQSVVPAPEEIRRRDQEVFIARGGTPGEEMDEQLRVEQEIKKQPAGRQNRNDLINLLKERHMKANAVSESSSRLSPHGNNSDHLGRATHESETTRIRQLSSLYACSERAAHELEPTPIRPGVNLFWLWFFLFLLLLLSGLSAWVIKSKL